MYTDVGISVISATALIVFPRDKCEQEFSIINVGLSHRSIITLYTYLSGLATPTDYQLFQHASRQREAGDVKMLRRKPTRLELKLDDTEEFESVKKELEVKSRWSSCNFTASQDFTFI